MSEYDFGRSFAGKLKKEGFDVTRIESHTTNGIPDMFVQGFGTDYWVELKTMTGSIKQGKWKIKWRPGQQAWAKRYLLAHGEFKCTSTLVKLDDGFLFIPMGHYYEGNTVLTKDVYVFRKLAYLKQILQAVSTTYPPAECDWSLEVNIKAWLHKLGFNHFIQGAINIDSILGALNDKHVPATYTSFVVSSREILVKVVDECIKNKQNL